MSRAPQTACPICARDLSDPQSVYVCGQCHGSLQATGAVAVHITGEFPAMSQLAMAPDDGADAAEKRPRSPTNPGRVACSWCGKPGAEVKKLLSQNGAQICNECVSLCADILTAELGDDWR